MSFELDEMGLLFGDDFQASEQIILRQPTIGDVIRVGEDHYYSVLQMLTAIPSDMKAALWDAGVDWNDMSDIEMFSIMVSQVPHEDTMMFFGDLDLSKFELHKKADGALVMVHAENGAVIDEYIHKKIQNFLCKIHNIKKKPEHAGNKNTKLVLVEEDRRRIQTARSREYESQLVPIISTLVNSPGFKYSLSDVRDMKYYAFIDSVLRLQAINNVQYLSGAYYSGNIDTKKFDVKKLDLFCDVHKTK